jgi:methionyl-tRNA formyltransferase
MMAKYHCVLLMTDRADLAGPAEAVASALFDVRHVSRHARDEKTFPAAAAAAVSGGDVDVLLNFLAPMIVPAPVLAGVTREAINIHPAPPDWPGIGSASYALYRGDADFGVTAHRMTSAIDGGEIVRVARFPVERDDTCESLFDRALRLSLGVFREVCGDLARDGALPPSGDRWARPAITRGEFERWMLLSPDDPRDEVARKVRALKHSRLPGPFFVIDGERVPVDEARLAPAAQIGRKTS